MHSWSVTLRENLFSSPQFLPPEPVTIPEWTYPSPLLCHPFSYSVSSSVSGLRLPRNVVHFSRPVLCTVLNHTHTVHRPSLPVDSAHSHRSLSHVSTSARHTGQTSDESRDQCVEEQSTPDFICVDWVLVTFSTPRLRGV